MTIGDGDFTVQQVAPEISEVEVIAYGLYVAAT